MSRPTTCLIFAHPELAWANLADGSIVPFDGTRRLLVCGPLGDGMSSHRTTSNFAWYPSGELYDLRGATKISADGRDVDPSTVVSVIVTARGGSHTKPPAVVSARAGLAAAAPATAPARGGRQVRLFGEDLLGRQDWYEVPPDRGDVKAWLRGDDETAYSASGEPMRDEMDDLTDTGDMATGLDSVDVGSWDEVIGAASAHDARRVSAVDAAMDGRRPPAGKPARPSPGGAAAQRVADAVCGVASWSSAGSSEEFARGARVALAFYCSVVRQSASRLFSTKMGPQAAARKVADDVFDVIPQIEKIAAGGSNEYAKGLLTAADSCCIVAVEAAQHERRAVGGTRVSGLDSVDVGSWDEVIGAASAHDARRVSAVDAAMDGRRPPAGKPARPSPGGAAAQRVADAVCGVAPAVAAGSSEEYARGVRVAVAFYCSVARQSASRLFSTKMGPQAAARKVADDVFDVIPQIKKIAAGGSIEYAEGLLATADFYCMVVLEAALREGRVAGGTRLSGLDVLGADAYPYGQPVNPYGPPPQQQPGQPVNPYGPPPQQQPGSGWQLAAGLLNAGVQGGFSVANYLSQKSATEKATGAMKGQLDAAVAADKRAVDAGAQALLSATQVDAAAPGPARDAAAQKAQADAMLAQQAAQAEDAAAAGLDAAAAQKRKDAADKLLTDAANAYASSTGKLAKNPADAAAKVSAQVDGCRVQAAQVVATKAATGLVLATTGRLPNADEQARIRADVGRLSEGGGLLDQTVIGPVKVWHVAVAGAAGGGLWLLRRLLGTRGAA